MDVGYNYNSESVLINHSSIRTRHLRSNGYGFDASCLLLPYPLRLPDVEEEVKRDKEGGVVINLERTEAVLKD